ncbi:MAG: hypothetical protein ACI4DO_05925 [Roseburia sp.]
MVITLSELLIAAVIGILAAVIFYVAVYGKYKMKWGNYRYDYNENSQADMEVSRDRFVRKQESRRRVQQSPPPSKK